MFLNFKHLLPTKKAQTNSADPDQIASEEVVWSGSSLFAIGQGIIWIPVQGFIWGKKVKNVSKY